MLHLGNMLLIPSAYIISLWCAFLYPRHQVNLPGIHCGPLALTAISGMPGDNSGMSWQSLWHREEFSGHVDARSVCIG